MKIKINISPQIFDFANMHNERILLEQLIFKEIKEFKFISELPEWTIELNINLVKNNWAGIYKKGTTTPSLSIRSHTIILPIPSNTEISWGINENKYVKSPPVDQNKFHIIEEITFSKYDNLSNYIVDSSYLLIMDLLKSGIKLKNINIKI